jgi:hypothetical protein
MPKGTEKAELFTEVPEKEGWNVVSGCCHCKMRRDESFFPDNPEFIEKYKGTCALIKKEPPVLCARSVCPIKLRLLIDANVKQPFRVYSADKPTYLWRFMQWLRK